MELHTFCRMLGFDAVWENKLFPVREQLLEHSDDSLPFFMAEDFYRSHYPFCHGPDNIWKRMDQVAEIRPGSVIPVVVMRDDKQLTLQVTIQEYPATN